MIGVATRDAELEYVREFFELFKTPWEPALPGRSYSAVISTVGIPPGFDGDTLIAFAAAELDVDRIAHAGVGAAKPTQLHEWTSRRFPIYQGAVSFLPGESSSVVPDMGPLAYRTAIGGHDCWRVGYGLFEEVSFLLTKGQPAANAMRPTLELHIEFVRELLRRSRVSFAEVPARPRGAELTCCLTHDIDFFGIRRHLFDRTLAGFLYRATVGAAVNLFRGRRSFREVVQNWAAVLSLPLVFLGVLRDPWAPLEAYEVADGPRPSTFFVVPFRGNPGVSPEGRIDTHRAVKYQASDVAGPLREAAARGRELGLHGIDAWRSPSSAARELGEVVPLAGCSAVGVRMHWLYADANSPMQLESAGLAYDSSCGYNEAVGYRAGTAQVFRAPGTRDFLELPLSIMDTALFYPGRLDLSQEEGLERCRNLIEDVARFGGVLVVNWHDRSLAPERLWGTAYKALLGELAKRRPWYATARDAVAWYRWRRSIRFTAAPDGSITVSTPLLPSGSPGASVVVHGRDVESHRDIALGGDEEVRLAL